MAAKKLKRKECLRCGNKWLSKLDRPKQCPRCKQPMWDVASNRKVKADAVDNIMQAQNAMFDAMGKIGKN